MLRAGCRAAIIGQQTSQSRYRIPHSWAWPQTMSSLQWSKKNLPTLEKGYKTRLCSQALLTPYYKVTRQTFPTNAKVRSISDDSGNKLFNISKDAKNLPDCKVKPEAYQENVDVLESLSDMDITEKVSVLENKIDTLGKQMEMINYINEVQMKIGRVNLLYTSGKIPVTRRRRFRKDILTAYGYSKHEINGQSSTMECLVLDHPVPSSSLVAAHLFKHEWRRVVQEVMGLKDIDGVHNGLPLFSPIEQSFDSLKLCILCHNDDYICHVLDPHLMTTHLVSMASKRPHWKKVADKKLLKFTFKDIHGSPIMFRNEHRPSRKILNFHARQARINAVSKGWIKESWDFPDFHCCDSREWKEKIKPWFERF